MNLNERAAHAVRAARGAEFDGLASPADMFARKRQELAESPRVRAALAEVTAWVTRLGISPAPAIEVLNCREICESIEAHGYVLEPNGRWQTILSWYVEDHAYVGIYDEYEHGPVFKVWVKVRQDTPAVKGSMDHYSAEVSGRLCPANDLIEIGLALEAEASIQGQVGARQ